MKVLKVAFITFAILFAILVVFIVPLWIGCTVNPDYGGPMWPPVLP